MEIDFDSILRTFLCECDEHLAHMEESLIGLESNPVDQSFLEAIFRGAHTIKGNAASLGYGRVEEFAHAFEEMLQHLRDTLSPVRRTSITLLLLSVDALREMIPEAIAGATELRPEHRSLMMALSRDALASDNPQPALAVAGKNGNEPRTLEAEEPPAKLAKPDTVRVDVQKLDHMLNLSGEIAVAHARLRQAFGALQHQTGEIAEAQAQLERLSLELQEQIMKARMVPLEPIFRHYARVVRDLAQTSGKNARLMIIGEDVEIDLAMVEQLKDSLTHMIRNAVDHGVESSEARQSRGKDICGVITLKAFHDDAHLIIQLSDDGAGLDRSRIAARVRSMGFVADPEQLSDQELFKFIFEPGFSTAEKVSVLSGRGVGMDVVRQNIEALRGTVELKSQPGAGTSITIRLPLTLAIIEGFAFGIADGTYIVPLQAVLECIEFTEAARHDGVCGIASLRGEPLPYVRLRQWFGLGDCRTTRENIVVIKIEGRMAGLAVDAFYGPQPTVIKPLDKRLQGSAAITGSTILGNGRVALILDLAALMREVIPQRPKNVCAEARLAAAVAL